MKPWMITTTTLVISAALFAFGFWAGALQSDHRALVERSKLEKAVEDKEEERARAVEELEGKDRDYNYKLTTALAEQQAQLRQEGDDREKKIREYYRKHPVAAVHVGTGTVSLWRDTNGEGRPNDSSPSQDPATPRRADGSAEGCTLADLHLNHEAVVSEYRLLSGKFVKLQEWAAGAYETCTSQVP